MNESRSPVEDLAQHRYVSVKAGYWWKIKIGDGTALYGKFYTKAGADDFCALLRREFLNGSFVTDQRLKDENTLLKKRDDYVTACLL